MSGFQVGSAAATNFGMPPNNYTAPPLPSDYGLAMSNYGGGGGNTGTMQLNSPSGWGSVSGAVPGADGGMFSGLGDWFKNSGVMNTQTEGPKGAVLQQQGWGMPALGAATGLLSAFMGMKQYGLAKDSLAESKRQFGLNYDAQRTTTNTQLEDRQRARVASNGSAYQSVGDYMSQNGIK